MVPKGLLFAGRRPAEKLVFITAESDKYNIKIQIKKGKDYVLCSGSASNEIKEKC
jgi:hypothetical protein